MDTISEFVVRTHTRGKGALPVKNIGINEARDIAAHINWTQMQSLAAEAGMYLPAVMQEISLLEDAHAASPDRMKVRAFLFGIATPHRDESQAIAWAHAVEHYIDELDPDAMAHFAYVSPVTGKRVNLGTYQAIAGAIRSGISRNVWYGNLDDLEATPGVGPKVARMIQAVLDPHHVSWTVDLWHARQLLWASGRDYRVAASVSKPAYAILEGVWLSYAAQYFPGIPTWAVQWATWCAADGRFVSHKSLWEDLASTEG
jgi:hypothetical protein